jgi:hypothetical protein
MQINENPVPDLALIHNPSAMFGLSHRGEVELLRHYFPIHKKMSYVRADLDIQASLLL